MKKYKLTEETIIVNGRTLYHIEALRDFANAKKGDKGGFVEKENNLSQYGDSWVYDNAKVFGNAVVCGYARVRGYAQVCGNAQVYGHASVRGNAEVYGNAEIRTNACIYGDAVIDSIGDYIVFKNFWSSGRSFTWTRSNDMWKVGCFYGTGEELIKKAYKESEISGREYERIVKYVETIKGK